MLFPTRREFFCIVWHEEMLNHNAFPLLEVFELYSSLSNNCGGEFWYSDMTNLRRQSLPVVPPMNIF